MLDELASIPRTLARLTLSPERRGDVGALQAEHARTIARGRQLAAERDRLLEQNGFGRNWLEVWWDCEKCQDTGVVEHRHYDGTFEPATTCDCELKGELDDILQSSGLVGPLGEQTFDAWDPLLVPERDRPVMIKTHQYCYAYAQEVAAGKADRGLLILGGVGLGKTFMCAAITHLVASFRKPVAYFTMADMMDFARRTKFDREGGDSLQAYLRVLESALIVIDDLGQERVTDFTAEELFSVINFRINRGLPFVISTNLTPDELDDRYGERIASRLFGFCDVLRFVGEDVRKTKRLMQLG